MADITQEAILMEYFTKNPNRDIAHPEIVDWVTSEYLKRTGKVFRDPDRGIRLLSQSGFLIKVKKGVYKYDPERKASKIQLKPLKIGQEESKGKQIITEGKFKFSEKLKTLLTDWRTIIIVIGIILATYFGVNDSCHSHNDEITKRVEAIGTNLGIVNDNILAKEKGNESVEDLQSLSSGLEYRYKAANMALAKGDFDGAENEANECSKILALIQPYVLSIDNKNISITAVKGFLSMRVDTGNATALTLNGEPVTMITLMWSDLPAPLASNQKLVMSYFLSPEGASFDEPVNITFYYGGNELPAGFPEERLILLTLDSENRQLIKIPNTYVNIETHSITMSVSRIAGHYILVAPSP